VKSPGVVRFAYWTGKPRLADLVAFFIANVSEDYISHGEIQDGRAIDTTHWSPTLDEVMRREFSRARPRAGKLGRYRLVVITMARRLVGLACIEVCRGPRRSYAVLHDGVVDSALRSTGIGMKAVEWILKHLKREGVEMTFLESAIGNERAHHFLRKQGFATISITMMKKLRE